MNQERSPSTLVRLFDELLEQPNVSADLRAGVAAARQALLRDEPAAVFLTVVLRTQGRRTETLRDMLLCLAAQTDIDFELVLAVHGAGDDEAAIVGAVLDEYRPLLPEHTRVIRVDGGTRAHPLNVAVSGARGRYVAFVDDDDLLFAHWIEEFRAASLGSRGRLLRATAGVQRIAVDTWPRGQAALKALSWPSAEYERTFDQVRHLERNHSPFMTFAFPSELFTVLGLTFDELLDVAEDWDLILRASQLLGVVDVPAMTAVYRRWTSGVSSYDVHSSEEWQRSEARLRAKLDRAPALLQEGSTARLRELVLREEQAIALAHIEQSRTWQATLVPRRIIGGIRELRRRIRFRR